MGYWLNEPSIREPARLVAGIDELADAGFAAVRIMLRNTNYTHQCPEVVAAIAGAAEAGVRRGVRVALDCEPHPTPVVTDIGRRFPEAIGKRLVRAEAAVIGRRFRVMVPVPGMQVWEGIEAAFAVRDGVYTRMLDLDVHVDWETEVYRDGDTRMHQDYADGRPGAQRYICRVSGACDGDRIVFYARFGDRSLVDFWAPGVRQYYRELLDCYKGVPLGGVGWDEPAVHGDWNSYRYGESFAEAFAARNGYALSDRLYLLDAPGTSPEAVRTRLDYYETLNEGLVDAQADLVSYSKALFGDDILLGTHHTWQGEGGSNDYRAGAVDYFRLADTQDAGYTDCWQWDMGSVSYAYALGTSLGRLSPTGETEVNTWHAKPTIAQVEYNARLMSLCNLTWFNIWYGDNADTCLMNEHYTWQATIDAMRRHDALQERLVGYKPVVDVAVLHGWETVAGINDVDVANAHKTFLINTSRLFTERSESFDFIDTRLLSSSTTTGGKLINALGSYRVLVMAYAAVLPEAAWRAAAAFARGGGQVVFVGPPPTSTTTGADLRAEFAEIAGLSEPLPFDDYWRSIKSWYTLPGGRASFLDCYVSLHAHSPSPLLSVENEPHGAANAAGNVVYLTDLDPRERLLDLVQGPAHAAATVHSDSVLWRVYENGRRKLLLAIAKEGRRLGGIVEFEGHSVRLSEGTVALVEVVDGRVSVEVR